MNKLVFHTPESGDWTVVTLNGEKIYEGHDHVTEMTITLTNLIPHTDYNMIEYKDEAFEEKF